MFAGVLAGEVVVRFTRATVCVLGSLKKDGIAKGVVSKIKSIRMLEEVMNLRNKEDDWEHEESDQR